MLYENTVKSFNLKKQSRNLHVRNWEYLFVVHRESCKIKYKFKNSFIQNKI